MAFADSFPGFRLRLTRWGIGFLVACVVLGLAAVNTGNNALMALLGLALGSYVVSGTWSRQVLGAIEATVELPSELYAGRPAVVDFELSNTSGLFPGYGLMVRDPDDRPVVRELFLATGSRSRHAVEIEFPRRGWHEIGPWRLDVLLPLGFFLKSKNLVAGRQVLVYPRLLQSSAASVRRGGGRRSPDALESRGREGEVTQLRDYREGDEVRSRDPADPKQLDRFEHMLSEVATGVVRRLREGVRVGLVVGPLVIPPVRNIRSARMLLRPLAEIEATSMDGEAPAAVDNGRTMPFSVTEDAPR
jgi:uncharacterized protein (DUF58 family)